MDFLKLLKVLTQDSRLRLSDICVMSVIVTYAQYQPNEPLQLSVTDILAEFPRLSRRAVSYSLQQLEQLNYIEVLRTPGQKNRYNVLIDLPEPTSRPRRNRNEQQHSSDIDKYKVVINKF